MKKIRCVLFITIILLGSISCDENKWLEEVPLDFYSTNNSYVTLEQFNSAVATLYHNHRTFFIANADVDMIQPVMGTQADNLYMFYPISRADCESIIPESGLVLYYWQNNYRMIFDANVIINRLQNASFTNEIKQNTLLAEARFFRALAYHDLGIFFGGVPIVLEEISAPKRDFVRASAAEVWAQVLDDLHFAEEYLPYVTDLKEDGRLTKAAANHLLTEAYIINEDWDNAIKAASVVINDPNYSLMTQRFGTHKNEPGDVFWDMFRRNNQNRNGKGGLNAEAIWVSQYEYNVSGGGDNYLMTRMFSPWYWSLVGKDNKPLFFGPSSQNGGRSVGFASSCDHMNYTIWEGDANDIRNSQYNILRDMVADNPASAYYGKKIVADDAILTPGEFNQYWRPYWTKYVPFNDFPIETISNNPFPGATHTSANGSFTDNYVMRLAETYLLRAEAYLGKGDQISAAADINIVRNRANAAPVSPANVDIDYILDERLRELCYEERRLLTLLRTKKLIDRNEKYNPHYNGRFYTYKMLQRVEKWPIPQSEIERNTEAVLEQNPGY